MILINKIRSIEIMRSSQTGHKPFRISQRNISAIDTIGKNTKEISFIKDEVRSSLGKMLLKFDKKSIFYKKYLQDSISRIGKSMEKISDGINDEDYIPTKFKNGDNPLFFIAICKK